MKKLELDKKLLGWGVLEIWEEVVGPRIASNAKPTAYRDSKLFVEVTTTAWVHELTFMRKDILTRINARLGKSVIRDIVFSLAR
ncbi:MAG: hypothetical protein AMJ46_02305 [Latescibacteria bacterium DG_63]|nr:MAG: hypothetical protein AMJ46_02305 [Latescibacteria bacterium DG_63]